MDDYIIHANIRRFSELLKTCADQERRETVERLLANEKEKLASNEQRPPENPPTDGQAYFAIGPSAIHPRRA
jgi:hypothetical protein